MFARRKDRGGEMHTGSIKEYARRNATQSQEARRKRTQPKRKATKTQDAGRKKRNENAEAQ